LPYYIFDFTKFTNSEIGDLKNVGELVSLIDAKVAG